MSTIITTATDGIIKAGTVNLCSVTLTSGTDSSTAIVYDGSSSGGNIITSIKSPAEETKQVVFNGARADNGIFIEISGTSAVISLEIE